MECSAKAATNSYKAAANSFPDKEKVSTGLQTVTAESDSCGLHAENY